MSKTRVYELAKTLNVDSKILVDKIKELGIQVTGHQSTLASAEVERIRKEFLGGQDSQPKVVVRRRRKADDEAETTGEVSESGTTLAAETKDVEHPAEEVKVATTATTHAEVPEEQDIPAPAETTHVELAKSKEKEVVEPAVVRDAPAKTELTAVAPTPAATAASELEEIRARKRERLMSSGAQIVRKASPEEIKAQQVSEQAAAKHSRAISREDSRGTRITSINFQQQGDLSAAPTKEVLERRRGEPEKPRAVVEEEEKPKVKVAPVKGKQTRINLRDLMYADEEVEEEQQPAPQQVRRTVYTPDSGGRKDHRRRKDLKSTAITMPRAAYRIVKFEGTMSAKDLAHQMSIKSGDIMKKLMNLGMMVNINAPLDFDTVTLIATDFGFEVKNVEKSIADILQTKKLSDYSAERLQTRPPIVTVMGHVDHGKTSILDTIRETEVAAGEAGGITQHIGAYTVKKDGKTIAFLDTPGHQAFSAMRSRGAQLTDIVVLVVAADDGVMPQTVEAISHAKDAGVPIIVAINKIDKPGANFDRIYNELTTHGVQSEEWGGDTQFVKVSALKKIGINELLEAINLQADMLQLKAVTDCDAEGTVVEAHLDKGRGPVATIMVQNGTLRVGDYVVTGKYYSKVRAMYDHRGHVVEVAGPSTPIQVIGLAGVPEAGDHINKVTDEKIAKAAVDWRIAQNSAETVKSSASSLDDLLNKIKSKDSIDLAFIVKADTQGSVEALTESITRLNSNDKNVVNKIIHKAVGPITSSDVALAATSGAITIGFNVRAPKMVEEEADKRGVVLKFFTIIYDALDAVKTIMTGAIPPVLTEEVLGHAQVKDCISVPKIGLIAGSAVTDGRITRNAQLRVIRDDVIIYNGKIKSLRRFKDDVKEVQQGYECGISIEGYNDIKVGDVIEAYVVQEVAATMQIQA